MLKLTLSVVFMFALRCVNGWRAEAGTGVVDENVGYDSCIINILYSKSSRKVISRF